MRPIIHSVSQNVGGLGNLERVQQKKRHKNPPIVRFSLASSSGLESVYSPIINVELSTQSDLTITVDYSVIGGTASGGVDYTLSPGTLTFNPGDLVKAIPLTITNNPAVESSETII